MKSEVNEAPLINATFILELHAHDLSGTFIERSLGTSTAFDGGLYCPDPQKIRESIKRCVVLRRQSYKQIGPRLEIDETSCLNLRS